jgi:putative Mn2+ efflux pump MntP
MDYSTLVLLSLGLSLDDFALAFALCLVWSQSSTQSRWVYASKMAVAFSISTTLLPLLGWLIGVSIFDWIDSYGAWVVCIIFCGVGGWIIKEGLENEPLRVDQNKIMTFGGLVVMGVLSSIDEGVIGIGFPFLDISIFWLIFSVVIVNTIIVFLAMMLSSWRLSVNTKIPPLLSGFILIILGLMNLF